MPRRCLLLLESAALLLGGCAVLPPGPSVMVLPAPGKPFEQFQTEDAACRQWASQQIGVSPAPAGQNTAVGALAGAALGTAVGGALGSASGHAGTGAAIGAGTGVLAGTAVGASADQAYGWDAQRRYDIAYQQCMYAKGNQLPGTGPRAPQLSALPGYPPPPPGYAITPPMPPGYPPGPVGSVPDARDLPPPPTP